MPPKCYWTKTNQYLYHTFLAIQKRSIKFRSNSSFLTHYDIQTLGNLLRSISPFKPSTKMLFVFTTFSSMNDYNGYSFLSLISPIYLIHCDQSNTTSSNQTDSVVTCLQMLLTAYHTHSPQHQ